MAPTNKKSFVGVDQVYYALVTTDNSSAYAAGTPVALAPIMNVSQSPKTNAKTQYADNQPFDVMNSEGETELELELTGVKLDDLAVLLGRVYNTATGRFYDNGGTPPDVALGFRAKMRGGFYRYFWFLKGSFGAPSEEQASETDTPDPKSIKLKYTAVRTTKTFALDGSVTDSVKRLIGDTSDTTFDASTWWNAVQTPTTGAVSALTCTPSPADGASGVAVATSPTLTFNNALRTGVTGIQLVNASTGAIVASAITIDATLKIVTIDPNSNMSGTTKHIITISGATDIYGQTLALTAYDFTTV
jgi:phi13 family phage major tail protein